MKRKEQIHHKGFTFLSDNFSIKSFYDAEVQKHIGKCEIIEYGNKNFE